tara:strand:+ start:2370 stop:2624 length:255 start_codon:yes stop_codon:yes gene_type:complete
MNINAFNINTSAINSTFAETRNYEVVGEPGAVFHMIVQNNSGQYYNFPENTVVDQAAGTLPLPVHLAQLLQIYLIKQYLQVVFI